MNPPITHILENKPKSKEQRLVFSRSISEQTGDMKVPTFQPHEFDHVRHLTGRLYYAWDDGRETKGTVYLGDIVTY